ncbi:putative igA Peptidase M64 [Lyophyllum shimeji]|uniref:IgA Peptidase M64 n=1 Tax=Lyophyllum shimeji TaxID=47721 RepID=A0A9P3PMU3_LYOSH|nr:putative igA Peptidase M64 [Lyophyllum shimeji]
MDGRTMCMAIILAVAFASLQGCYCAGPQSVLQVQEQSLASLELRPSLSEKCEAVYPLLKDRNPVVSSPPLEVHPLVVSGPSSNRVDLVFFSDGYLPAERDKFLEDAARLAGDISANQTFATVRPLLNFWAAFSPSKESGIGVGGQPKDTRFGLYRDGTELRAVYYDKPEVAKAACSSLGEQCDYPILLVLHLRNDPYYGGLGGDYTVITSSLANGPLVLRHELGHSIIQVGEEYDGGFAYFGVNAYHDLSKPVPWEHWLSASHENEEGHRSAPRVERSVMPMQQYPWTLLNSSSPWSVTFTSSGTYARHLVRFSLSGLPEASDLRVELDGKDLGWAPRKDIGLDRWHYDIHSDESLKPGEHEVKFTLLNAKRTGVAQLCSIEVLEFGKEEEFISTPGNYGVYPTFSEKNETSYRPTNEDCLMRIVTSPNFCKVCIEGLWLSLLKRVSLIDDVKEGCEQGISSDGSAVWVKTIDVQLVPLAQFREARVSHESYTIKWWKDRKLLEEFADKTRVEIPASDAPGIYSIGVTLTTDEVRVDKDKLLSAGVKYHVTSTCSSE